jgi:hypothetical protein
LIFLDGFTPIFPPHSLKLNLLVWSLLALIKPILPIPALAPQASFDFIVD